MGDMRDEDKEEAPPYANYLYDIYRDGLLSNTFPVVTTSSKLLEEQARKTMTPKAFNYVYGGAGEGATMDANRLAFRQWKLVPRFMRSVKPRDLKTELFGHVYDSPVIVAPIGVQGIIHTDKEAGIACACAALRVPYTLSTAATSTIEEVASAMGGGSARWFQLYWPSDDAVTASLLRRAKAAGYAVLVVTLDTPMISWRPSDLDAAYIPFLQGVGNAVGYSDPAFRAAFARDNDGAAIEDAGLSAALAWTATAFPGEMRPWEDLALLRKHWDGPIVLKGVQCAEDARLALRHGADGIVVSNHGGRQVDGAIGSLEALPEVVDAVGAQMTVMFDSGIRTGADIVKALALGARAVMVGRPVVYGLGIAGQDGARCVLAGILADFDQTMGLLGVKSVKDLNRSMLRRCQYGGDVKASL